MVVRYTEAMEIRLLGWAGVQLRSGDASLVIDPLREPAAVWAYAGERARDVPLPKVVPAEPAGAAGVGLVTHLHRDHADAAALAAALLPGAPVLVPEPYGGSEVEEAGLIEAGAELDAAGLEVRPVRAWERHDVEGWQVTALPAVDGSGDPQVSWLVARDGVTIVHAGDTMWHGGGGASPNARRARSTSRFCPSTVRVCSSRTVDRPARCRRC